MRSQLSAVSAIVLCLVLSGCATTGKLEEKMQAHVGQTTDQLVAEMGVPTGEYKSETGRILTYHMSHGSRGVAQTSGGLTTVSAHEKYCDVTFTADSNNVVTGYKYEGNRCRAH